MYNIETPDPTILPDVVLTQNGSLAQTQLTTIRNVQYIIEQSGIEPRLNMASASVDWFINGEPADNTQAVQENIELMFFDLCTYCRIKQHEQVRAIVGNLAKFKAFHPMEEWMKGLAWDGVDRIGDLVSSVTTDNVLWPVYLENWLVQTVEGVCGWRRERKLPLPHVLVLVGAQGLGKSHWLKSLGGRWFKGEAELHLSTANGKDHQIAALRFPMVELSELNGIFRKADIETLKSFLTREEDEIRAPYERRALVRPRMTSFCGSVNEAEFLNDTSGSRRFWPVMVEAIDWSAAVDLDQLWAQAYAFWQEDSAFNLTAEEDAIRASVAIETHTAVTEEAELVLEFYRRHHGNKRFPDVPMNRTEILRMLYGTRVFSPKQRSDMGRALLDLIGKHKKIEGKQRAWWFPYNEFATDRSTWPDKNHLKSV